MQEEYCDLTDVHPNPNLPMPTEQECFAALLNFPSPKEWALNQCKSIAANTEQWEELRKSGDREGQKDCVAKWLDKCERISMLVVEGVGNGEACPLCKLAAKFGVSPARYWLYDKEESSPMQLFLDLENEVRDFYPYVQSQEHLEKYAKQAIRRVEMATTDRLLATFRGSDFDRR